MRTTTYTDYDMDQMIQRFYEQQQLIDELQQDIQDQLDDYEILARANNHYC